MDLMVGIFPIIGLLFSLLPLAIAIFVIYMWINLSRERNAYLKEIAEELRKR